MICFGVSPNSIFRPSSAVTFTATPHAHFIKRSLPPTNAAPACARITTAPLRKAGSSARLRGAKLDAASSNSSNRVMLYFAYGSNLDWAQMKQRCPLAKFVWRAKLPAHRLAFTLKSAKRDCGVADVLHDQTKVVWGVVYELPYDELKNLDKKEGYTSARPNDQNGYSREDHYVWR